ncbi:MAG: hypothetical protein V2B15_14265 [Bacteroidota bacterium]
MEKKGLTIALFFILLFIGISCAPAKRASVENKRRGLLMLEGEHIYKNKGFYSSKKASKRHKKSVKYHTGKRKY